MYTNAYANDPYAIRLCKHSDVVCGIASAKWSTSFIETILFSFDSLSGIFLLFTFPPFNCWNSIISSIVLKFRRKVKNIMRTDSCKLHACLRVRCIGVGCAYKLLYYLYAPSHDPKCTRGTFSAQWQRVQTVICSELLVSREFRMPHTPTHAHTHTHSPALNYFAAYNMSWFLCEINKINGVFDMLLCSHTDTHAHALVYVCGDGVESRLILLLYNWLQAQ